MRIDAGQALLAVPAAILLLEPVVHVDLVAEAALHGVGEESDLDIHFSPP